jgi:magnesium chelatase subunit D
MTGPAHPDPPTAWDLAISAAAVLAVAPHALGGVRLRGPAGTVRDTWLERFRGLLAPGTPVRRMPAAIGDGRLLGGLDLAATLQSGRPVAESGLLSEADEGILLMAMAERMSALTAAKIAMVMDRGMAATERDGITLLNPARFGAVALDEGLDDEEQPPRALTERLALVIDLRTLSHRDITGSDNHSTAYDQESVMAAQLRLASVTTSDAIMTALCSASMAMGIGPLRASLQALLAARILAALAGRDTVTEADAAMAAMLVLAPRATQLPTVAETMDEESPEPEEPQQETRDQAPEEPATPDNDHTAANPPPLEDVVLDAAVAAIPAGLLALLQSAGQQSPSRAAGRAGKPVAAANRGRVIGSKVGDTRSGARLDVVETLRAAAPWQMLRRRDQSYDQVSRSALAVRREDFRIVRYKQRTQTTTVFVVDASGSSALQRLAEAKGAVRLLLADCYIRRDEVAMIAFRGQIAELILPPTRALARAQRALAALPGGGGTPIAAAIDAAADMVDAVRRSGRTPAVVFMTDGRANITRAGKGGRGAAQDEARSAAAALRLRQCGVILIDTSPQPQPLAAELAVAMGARYVPLPHADARRVAQAVTTLREDAA